MTRNSPSIDLVIKVGGSLLKHPAQLDVVLAAIGSAAGRRRLLIVPGGGLFADAVRQVDRDLALPDDAAHWMAVLAMDQYAHVITARLAGSALVIDAAEATAALERGCVPVLAVSRWLSQADPLPHTWEVTSDSIAAWVAGEVGATRLVLVKPPGAAGDTVDGYFARALPPGVTPVVISADRADAIRDVLLAGGQLGH